MTQDFARVVEPRGVPQSNDYKALSAGEPPLLTHGGAMSRAALGEPETALMRDNASPEIEAEIARLNTGLEGFRSHAIPPFSQPSTEG